MRVLLDLATVTAAAVGLLWGCGFLLARLVPWRFQPLLPLIAPFLGFSVISAIGHYAGTAGLSLRSILWLFITLAAAGWAVVALEFWRRRRSSATAKPAIAICVLAFVVAVAPLLLLGYLTTIGMTIDGLSYAVRSEYLQDAPLRMPDPEAGKPWIDWVRSHIDIFRAGDVMLVGVLGALTGRRSYELLTVVPALFFALTAGSVFVWARASLRLGQGGALLASLLAALSNLLLWPAYDNFLSQALGISFIPLVLCFGIEAERRPDWRMAALFGLLLSGLVSVYPIYTVYALAMVLCFWAATWLLRPGAPRAQALGRASLWWSGALAAAFLWNGFALVRSGTELGQIFKLLAPEGAKYVGAGNILFFPPAIEVLGLISHAWAVSTWELSIEKLRWPPWPELPYPVLKAAAFGLLALAAFGWWRLGEGAARQRPPAPSQARRQERRRDRRQQSKRSAPTKRLFSSWSSRLSSRARLAAAATLLVSAALAAQQRWGVNQPHGYPYGWFKAISVLTPLLLALVAAGLAAVWRRRSWRWLAAVAALLLLAVNARRTLWTVSFVAENLVPIDRELIQAAQAASATKPGAWILVDLTAGLRERWLGYLLRDRKIRFVERIPDTSGAAAAFFEYAVVERDVDRQRRGVLGVPWYDPLRYSRLWSGSRYELRARRDPALANLPWGKPWPAAAVLDLSLARASSLTARLGPEVREVRLGPGTPRTLQMHVFSLNDESRLEVSGTNDPVALPTGGWLVDLDLGCLNGERLAIGHPSGEVILSDLQILGSSTGPPGACVEKTSLPSGLAYVEQAPPAGDRVRFEAVVLRPRDAGQRRYRLALHVIEPAHGKLFGVWSLDFGPEKSLQRGVLEIDLGDRSSRGEIQGRPTPPSTSNFDTGAGFFHGDAVWWQLDPTEQLLIEPMLWFQRTEDGSVEVKNTVAAARLGVIPPP